MRTMKFTMIFLLVLLAGCFKNDGARQEERGTDSRATVGERLPSERPQVELPPAVQSTVEQVFARYKQAIEENDGKAAASLVTTATFDQYETARRIALDSSEVDFDDISQLEVLLIFQLRFMLAKSTLEESSGRKIFEWAVSDGLVKKEVFDALEIDKVQYDGENAFGAVTKGGRKVPNLVFVFRKEGGRWKFDMVELQRLGDSQVDELRKQAGKSKIEFAVFLLERTYGEQIPPDILYGPLELTRDRKNAPVPDHEVRGEDSQGVAL